MLRSTPSKTWRSAIAAALVALGLVHGQSASAGTWTKLTTQTPAPGGAGTMLLLTDGTVMVQGGGVTARWDKLNPDSNGNYINGTWSSVASMGLQRLYFASHVLPNGKLWVLGGEYSGPQGSQNITNTGEIYDPVANTWTPIPNFPQPQFGDDPSILLGNGKILCGYIFDGRTYLYDIASNSWSQTGTKLRNDRSDEETWILLPDGSVLSYDIFGSQPNMPGHAQKYVPSTGTWVDTGTVPVYMTGNNVGFELGPATLLPDGRLIQIGANELTALYSPATNTWSAGPLLPNGMGSDDAAGVMLPSGHFLFAADFYLFNSPTKLFDYNYLTNTVTDVTVTLPNALSTRLASLPAFVTRFLMLPNGHALFSAGGELWDYDSSPDGLPLNAWKPAVSTVTNASGNTYTLTGKQLTGISQGASYGDDAEMDTNYPIVRLTDSNGLVKYAKTTNWTPSVATGASTTSTNFTLPTGLASGQLNLVVIANGIPSAVFKFTPGSTTPPPAGGIVTYAWNPASRTLTLTGDAKDNYVTATWRGDRLTLTASNETKIQNGAALTTSVSVVTGTGAINVAGDLKDGADSLTLVSMPVNALTIRFGNGNDKCTLSYCTVNSSTADGGANTDTFTSTTSSITSKSNINFEVDN